MRLRTCTLSVFTLGAALLFGIEASAGDLPKEGTFTATYSSVGTVKITPLGKERWFAAFDENGLTVGGGLLDHMAWHCWGILDGASTIVQYRNYCVSTDPAGDQIGADVVSDGKIDLSKPFSATASFVAGTGKYAGISGGWSFVGHSSEFKTPDGTYVQYGPIKGSYKLPPLTQ